MMEFNSQADGKRQVKKYLAAHVNDTEHFESDFLSQLISHHPDKEKIQDVVAFHYGPYGGHSVRGRGEQVLQLVRGDGSTEDISYIKCIRQMFSSKVSNKRADIVGAFRKAIHDTKRKTYLYDNCTRTPLFWSGTCTMCGQSDIEVCVDHDLVPFHQILETFLMDRGGVCLMDVKVEKHETIADLADGGLKGDWIEYHDSTVVFDILCPACNGTKSDSGYKRGKRAE